jgi:multidrug resistance efflux pump
VAILDDAQPISTANRPLRENRERIVARASAAPARREGAQMVRFRAVAVLVSAVLVLACGGRDEAERLRLAGTIEARTVEVGSLVGGRVERVAVEEGSEVAAGDLLVAFESELLDRQLEVARARVAGAEARLRLAEAGPRREARERARLDWEAAKTDLRRLEALHRDGVVDRASYDRAVVREATAKQTFAEADRGTRREEIEAVRAALDGERAELARLERERSELQVHAPAAGRVESIDLRPGDLVAANRPVATLLEPGQLWVRVYLPEPRLGEAAVGQSVAVAVDSFPGRTFPGRIVEIRHQAEYLPRNVQTLDQRSDQVFGVKVALESAADLRPGMATTVTLTHAAANPR